jgi:hypothetical protein
MNDFVIQPKATHGFTASQRRAARQSRPDPSAGPPAPSRDDIARRAYNIYVKAGSPEGHFEQSWHQAERDLHRECQGKCGAQGSGRDKTVETRAQAAPKKANPSAAEMKAVSTATETAESEIEEFKTELRVHEEGEG